MNKLFKTIRNINLPFENSQLETKDIEMQKINQLIQRDYEKIGFQDAIYEPSQAIIDIKLDRFKFQLLMEYQTLIDKRKCHSRNALSFKSERHPRKVDYS